jgi:DNA-binding MarR family transcriptional regulator
MSNSDTAVPTDDNIGWRLSRALRAYNERAIASIRAVGYDDITLSHAAVLPHIGTDGIRISEIALRAGMTKQAASQLIRELEACGYVERRQDPRDGRAEQIRFTPKGLRFRRDAHKVKAQQEHEIGKALGLGGKKQLAKLLAEFPWLR